MLTDSSSVPGSLVGAMIAQGTRPGAESGDSRRTSFNFNRYWDQQVVTGATANLTGTVTTVNGSIGVVGAGTAFDTQAKAGTWIRFGTDVDALGNPLFYRVASQSSATALNLTQQYQGTGAAGLTVKRQTYNSVVRHRYAIALAVRPLEIVNDGHIHSRCRAERLPFRVWRGTTRCPRGCSPWITAWWPVSSVPTSASLSNHKGGVP
jgi:hypothetical protein